MKLIKENVFLILSVLIAVVAILPLFQPGFFPMHDDAQVSRVFVMNEAIRDGMMPVRWSKDLGYGFGYPIFNFYNPTPYYLGGILAFFTPDYLTATKIMMILGIIFSGIFMYLLAKQFWGKMGGIISALFYVYAPYHAVQVYVRGDVTEFWAYALIPLLFLGAWRIYKKQSMLNVALISISYALIITTHNLSAMMITPFLLLFTIFLILKNRDDIKKVAKYYFLAFLFGIGLSAFYWLPTFLEMNYTDVMSVIGGGSDFRDHFVCINQLWTGSWGFAGSGLGCEDGISFMIGKYHIFISFLVSLIALFLYLNKNLKSKFKNEKELIEIILISFIGFLLSIFLLLEYSKFIWELLIPMKFIQFPWRMLIPATFFSSFLCGAILWYMAKFINKKYLEFIAFILISLFIITVSTKFFLPQNLNNKSDSDYISEYNLKWTVSRVSDEYLPPGFAEPKNYSEVGNFKLINSEDFKINNLIHKSNYIRIDYLSKSNRNIVIPLAYFPAWQVFINGEKSNSFENKKGTEVYLPKGENIVEFIFIETNIEKIGNLITILSILLLGIGIYYSINKNEKNY